MPSKIAFLEPRAQVAALPWRQGDNEPEILLITSRQSGRWLLPKGWPMKGKTPCGAAAQEALEEAGIKGSICEAPVGSYFYDKLEPDGRSTPCSVEVYPLRVERELEDWPEAAVRTRSWVSVSRAATLVHEDGLSDFLRQLDPAVLAESVERRKKRAKRK